MEGFEERNYYELLGVERDASVDEIKTQYKDLARVFHPDSNFYAEIIQDPLEGEELEFFKRLTAAYNTLIDTKTRAQYDQSLAPNLKGWDESGEAQKSDWNPHAFMQELKMKRAENRGMSSGSPFGTTPRPSAMERSANGAEPEPEMVASVADIMKRRRSLLGRVLSLFGL